MRRVIIRCYEGGTGDLHINGVLDVVTYDTHVEIKTDPGNQPEQYRDLTTIMIPWVEIRSMEIY